MSYDQLTRKQQLIIDAYVEKKRELPPNTRPTDAEVAAAAYDNCDGSYVWYVRNEYEDVVKEQLKQPVADGEGHYMITLSISDTMTAIRMLPKETSQKIYEQIRDR